MNMNAIIYPEARAFLTRNRGAVILLHEIAADWLVPCRRAKVLFHCAGKGWVQIGKPLLLN